MSGLPGMGDALLEPEEGDTAASEFRRRRQIREQVQRRAFQVSARDRVHLATRIRRHQDVVFHPGQWVFVRRRVHRTTTKSDHLGARRDRWCGPGVVVMQNAHTVYVSVRARLWKCSVDQVRHASEEEELGCTILQDPQWRVITELFREAGPLQWTWSLRGHHHLRP